MTMSDCEQWSLGSCIIALLYYLFLGFTLPSFIISFLIFGERGIKYLLCVFLLFKYCVFSLVLVREELGATHYR